MSFLLLYRLYIIFDVFAIIFYIKYGVKSIYFATCISFFNLPFLPLRQWHQFQSNTKDWQDLQPREPLSRRLFKLANRFHKCFKPYSRVTPVHHVNIELYNIIKSCIFRSQSNFNILQSLFCLKLKIVPSYQLAFGIDSILSTDINRLPITADCNNLAVSLY